MSLSGLKTRIANVDNTIVIKSDKPWIQHFNLDPRAVSLWQSQVAKGRSIIFWCLETGKIPLLEYLRWAREHYQLAVVKENYFQLPADASFWRQISSVANWSAELLPLEQWEGTVFVACVEPPTQVNWSFPVRYLLATPRCLNKRWQELESLNRGQAAKETFAGAATNTSQGTKVPDFPPAPIHGLTSTPDAVAKKALVMPPKDQLAPTPELLVPKVAPQNLTPPPQPPSQPTLGQIDMPEGFSLNLSSTNLINLAPTGLSLPATNVNVAIAPDSFVDESPTGVHHTEEDFSDPFNLPNSTPRANIFNEEITNTSDIASNSPISQALATPQTTAVESTSAAAGYEPQPDWILRQRPDGPIKVDELLVKNLNAVGSPKEVMRWLFKELKVLFDHQMILQLNQMELLPLHWDDIWKPTRPEALLPIRTQSPSLFKIATRTRMPYHGFVVQGPVHNEFFTNWGFAKLPEHVTAIPMIVSDTFWGLYLGVGSSSPNTTGSLPTARRVVYQASQGLVPYLQRAA